MSSIHQCRDCAGSLHAPHVDVLLGVVITPCAHLFHRGCLQDWVTHAEKPCPVCKSPIYQHQAGTTAQGMFELFVKIVHREPHLVTSRLSDDEEASRCAICLDDLPRIPLRVDTVDRRLTHETCDPNSSLHCLPLDTVVSVVWACRSLHSDLNQLLTPTPPSLRNRLSRDYPEYYPQTMAVITVVSTLGVGHLLDVPPARWVWSKIKGGAQWALDTFNS